ncbi:MAG: flavodoxin-dependent (E)-4-hydroxy-3-methylbut-2-enyl-diphosphate synthase [Candidatus Omnitrophota bacterium]|nr:MAG: flavodoxin-dependent (E)-4-hydroxy-3-methylbut-2-enyl-diphosphate synthase [Candidatus Omnitrophota bacterium]
MRSKTKEIRIGKVKIGGDNPIAVQSMCSTDTKDEEATIKQIHDLEEHGCELARVSVPDKESLLSLRTIKENISIPLIADIHFDYKLAIEAARVADKIRINPGNIGKENIKSVVDAAMDSNTPVRVGINLGSLEKDIEKKFGLTALGMVESAMRSIKEIERLGFYNIIVSLKASDVLKTIEAYKLFSQRSQYPLHVGITESGSSFSGTINSSVGIGALLLHGIGDTIRVSLSAEPVEEVKVAWQILKALRLRKRGIDITSCPTCARKGIHVIKITKELEQRTSKLTKHLHIAVMGCGVNGPGESKEADIGVVGGKGNVLLYRNGMMVGKIEGDVLERLMKEIENA